MLTLALATKQNKKNKQTNKQKKLVAHESYHLPLSVSSLHFGQKSRLDFGVDVSQRGDRWQTPDLFYG